MSRASSSILRSAGRAWIIRQRPRNATAGHASSPEAAGAARKSHAPRPPAAHRANSVKLLAPNPTTGPKATTGSQRSPRGVIRATIASPGATNAAWTATPRATSQGSLTTTRTSTYAAAAPPRPRLRAEGRLVMPTPESGCAFLVAARARQPQWPSGCLPPADALSRPGARWPKPGRDRSIRARRRRLGAGTPTTDAYDVRTSADVRVLGAARSHHIF